MSLHTSLCDVIPEQTVQVARAAFPLRWTLYDPATPAWLREIPAVQTLRHVWLQQFYASPDDQPVRWR